MSDETLTAEDAYAEIGRQSLDDAKDLAMQTGVGCVLIVRHGPQLHVWSVDSRRLRIDGDRVIIDASDVLQSEPGVYVTDVTAAQTDADQLVIPAAPHDHQVPAEAEDQRGPNGEQIFVASVTQED